MQRIISILSVLFSYQRVSYLVWLLTRAILLYLALHSRSLHSTTSHIRQPTHLHHLINPPIRYLSNESRGGPIMKGFVLS